MLVALDKVGVRMLSMLRSFGLAGGRDQRLGLSLLGFAALGPGLYTWFATSALIPLGDDQQCRKQRERGKSPEVLGNEQVIVVTK